MGIQRAINWDKPIGRIRGEIVNGGELIQNHIHFDREGVRVTPITPEERAADEREKAAMQVVLDAQESRSKAAKSTEAVNKAAAEKHAAENPPPKKEGIPEGGFTPANGWTKPMMIATAKRKFGVDLDPAAHYNTIAARLKALY